MECLLYAKHSADPLHDLIHQQPLHALIHQQPYEISSFSSFYRKENLNLEKVSDLLKFTSVVYYRIGT